MEFVGNLGTLDCAYFLAFGVGVIWAIFVVVTGGLGGDVDVDMDAGNFDLGHPDHFDTGSVDVSPISPITIASFITAFGAVGVIARQAFSAPGVISILAATAGGLVVAGLMFVFYSKLLIGSQGSSEVRVSQLAGLTAEVVTPIAADGVGEIALVAQGSRVSYPARSSRSEAIKRGQLVIIDRMLGSQALVSPKADE